MSYYVVSKATDSTLVLDLITFQLHIFSAYYDFRFLHHSINLCLNVAPLSIEEKWNF